MTKKYSGLSTRFFEQKKNLEQYQTDIVFYSLGPKCGHPEYIAKVNELKGKIQRLKKLILNPE